MDKDTKILKIQQALNKEINNKAIGTYCQIEFIIEEWEKLNK